MTPPHGTTHGGIHPPTAHEAPLADVRVLVVEDDPDGRELVIAILVDAGANVIGAESAAAALEALPGFRPQLVVSDIGMPDEDGYSLMRKIRSLPARDGGQVRAVALSAFTSADARAQALESGFAMHIGKPLNPPALIAALVALSAP